MYAAIAVWGWLESGARPEKKKGRTASNSTSKKAAFAAPLVVTWSLEELDAVGASVCLLLTRNLRLVVGIKGLL